jgi:RNA polymerase sigma factor (sigma-70 family)
VTAEDRPPDSPLDPAAVAALHAEHAAELRRFLVGVLRDPQLAADVAQTAFVRLAERGGGTRPATRKAWLFRVAFHEALLVRRKDQRSQRILRKIASSSTDHAPTADAAALRAETVETVRRALAELSPDQQAMVRKRVYEDRTFAEAARELGIPLGTALARMQAALARLRRKLSGDD